MPITKDQLRTLRGELQAALSAAQIAQRFGLKSLTVGNCSFHASGSFTFKLEGVTADGLSKEAQAYNELRELMPELPPLGTSFEQRGTTFTVTGANTTGSKILATAFTGKTYLFRVPDMVRMFKGRKT